MKFILEANKMRCRVLKCYENEDGCCMCSSYVEIDENGQCDRMYVPTESEVNEDEEAEVEV
jgi:hypothetical protein